MTLTNNVQLLYSIPYLYPSHVSLVRPAFFFSELGTGWLRPFHFLGGETKLASRLLPPTALGSHLLASGRLRTKPMLIVVCLNLEISFKKLVHHG